jgi:hypothetical protein|tara:strand:- start:9639 stop:9842 length:204 start_codon:yes stop_codon:yes gene_type:complete
VVVDIDTDCTGIGHISIQWKKQTIYCKERKSSGYSEQPIRQRRNIQRRIRRTKTNVEQKIKANEILF